MLGLPDEIPLNKNIMTELDFWVWKVHIYRVSAGPQCNAQRYQ